MDKSIVLIDNEENVVNICGRKFKEFNVSMMKCLFTKYKDENMRKIGVDNPLFNKTRLTQMCNLIIDSRFIESYNNEDDEFNQLVDSLFDCLDECFKNIVGRREDPATKTLFDVLKNFKDTFSAYSSDEDLQENLQQNFGRLSADITTKAAVSRNTGSVGLTATVRKMFSGIEFINEDIASGESTIKDSSIFPFDVSASDAFLRSCEALGNKIKTGVMMGDVNTLLDTYKSAFCYFYYTIRKYTTPNSLTSMTDAQKFNFFFTGSTSIEDKTRPPLLDNKGKVVERYYRTVVHKDISIRFLEYLTDFCAIYADQLGTQDIFSRNLQKFTQISNLELIDKLKNSVLSYEGDIIKCDSLPIDERSAKKITKNLFDVLIPIGAAGNAKEEAYLSIQESVTTRMKPYWWQQEAIDKAKYGQSFINIGPTSGGKTFGAMLVIAKLIFLPKTQGKLFVFSSPIDQLAIQTFSSMYVSFEGIRDKIALICGCATYIPAGATFFIGTPKELRDYFREIPDEVEYEKSNASVLLPKCITQSRMKKAYTLIIDECHTISENYIPTYDGRKISKANEELLEMLHEDVQEGEKNERIFVGLSATLSDVSMRALVNRVREKTNISDIDIIYYDYPDIGKYDKPTEDIIERVSAHKLPQIKYPVCLKNGIITKALIEDEIMENIEINPPFIEQLLYKAKEEQVLPIALFFESEAQGISKFRSFIDYVNRRIDQSQWKALYLTYHAELESRSSRANSQVKIQELKTEYEEKLKQKILEHLGEIRTVGSHIIPFSILNPLLNMFKSLSREEFDNTSMKFTIDLYAFLVEYCEYKKTGHLFQCRIHPYYNFGDNGIIPIIDNGDNTSDFSVLLQAQDITSNNRGGNALINITMNGLEYGFSIMTSSIPVGTQMKNAEIVNSLKVDKNKMKSSASFCDYGMSQGVDLPFNSVAIFREYPDDISESQYLQENGRCGRNRGDGKFGKSITFTINVKNAFRIRTAENLSFESTQLSANFYLPEEITEKLSNIVQNTESVISLIQTKQSVNIESFITEELFPGVLHLKQTSERINFIKRELREMYEICKVVCPKTAQQYIAPLFRVFQKEGYSLIMASAT